LYNQSEVFGIEEVSMKKRTDWKGLTRREFLKIGAFSATAAAVAPAVLAGSSRATPNAPGSLAFRTLGRTGLKVTVVSFGAMLTPEHEVIRAGLDMGMNYVDTARVYLSGRSEEVVGRALKGIRDKVYVATKTRSDTKKEIMSDVDTSLSKLKTDRIDVIQLHNLRSPDRAFLPEVREALTDLRKQGKVRFFGVTTHTNQAEVLNGIAGDPAKFFDVALVGYNFKSDKTLRDAVAGAAKTGVGIVAMKTQAGGYKTEAMGGVSPHQAALKWVLADPNVTCAIPGMKDMEMLAEDSAVMGMRLTRADERVLEQYGASIAGSYCHLCGRCEPSCPLGVAISDMNRGLMYAEAYGEMGLARATYRSVPPERSAASCEGCDACLARCPRGLDVAAKMGKARTLLS
jgi:predicted aldo/keto reductase-like oxidoreductase